MADRTLRFARLIFMLSFANKISSSHAEPTLTEYLIAALGSNAPVPPKSPSRLPSTYQNYGLNYQTPPPYSNPAKQSPSLSGPLPKPLTAIANLAAAIPVSESINTPNVPEASEIPSTPLDSNVLNNLAIALQLLIVSNILNTPPETLSKTKFEIPKVEVPKFETVPISPLSSLALPYPVKSMPLQSSLPYIESPVLRNLLSYESLTLPNSKFLGSSNFLESPVYGSAVTPYRSPVNPLGSSVTPQKPNVRSSMTLMSPYEALGSGSPFSDPILSSVLSNSYSKKDFQSPYASILAADGNRDLFSMTDFL